MGTLSIFLQCLQFPVVFHKLSMCSVPVAVCVKKAFTDLTTVALKGKSHGQIKTEFQKLKHYFKKNK